MENSAGQVSPSSNVLISFFINFPFKLFQQLFLGW